MQISTQIDINGRSYEIISFNVKQTNKSISTRGVSLAQGNIAISGSGGNYRIYNTQSGEPVFKCRFIDFQDALNLALWIEEVYADWFDIWKAYPEADLLLWCRYSVPNGLRLFEMKEALNKLDVITNKDIAKAYQEVKERKEK